MLIHKKTITAIICHTLLLLSFTGVMLNASAQDTTRSITTYQYRHVPADKTDEFIRRETTYWTKVAEKAVEANKMSFWALLEKVSGVDLPNSSNYLFINTFPNIDDMGDVFGNIEKITGLTMDKIETNSMSTTTSQVFLHDGGWVQASFAKPASDFNYVVMNYHNSSAPSLFVGTEIKYWQPFIQDAMNKKQTPQKGWGNAVVLSPSGENVKFNSVSYDLFTTLGDALMPVWDPKIIFPAAGIDLLDHIRLNRPATVVYRIVKVVSKN